MPETATVTNSGQHGLNSSAPGPMADGRPKPFAAQDRRDREARPHQPKSPQTCQSNRYISAHGQPSEAAQCPAIDGIEWKLLPDLSRPARLGTRARRPRQRAAQQGAGASRFGGAEALSLDTEKQLATSFAKWSADQRTEEEIYQEQKSLRRILVNTVHAVYDSHAARPKDDLERVWLLQYEDVKKALPGETDTERWKRSDKWRKEHKPFGKVAEMLKWEKAWTQLERCQTEWIGYKSACACPDSPAIAVPVGCNHRLCPLCAYHRSQRARLRIKTMFDRLSHPIFITLTIPNRKTIRKHDFHLFRKRVRKFLAQYDGYIKGGIYSLETTFNRLERTWHIHVHVLADACASLPSSSLKIQLAGEREMAFMAIKYRMEFDWVRMTTGTRECPLPWGKEPGRYNYAKFEGKRYQGMTPKRLEVYKRIDRDKRAAAIFADQMEFEEWIRQRRAHALKEWNFQARKYQPIPGLSDAEIARRTAWNAKNTRVIDVRGVDDREAAAREVLKYITKAADFCDLPYAVEAFCDATKGARLVQTFGTWYGFDPDTAFDPEHIDDWSRMECPTCGARAERMGVFHWDDVRMDANGRFYIGGHVDITCGGTVLRPTIRAPLHVRAF
jgi:hypothetical protein